MKRRALWRGGVVALVGLTGCGSTLVEPAGSGGGGGQASSGSAAGACATGYADCNGDPADGCEAALASDSAHCGTCDRDCQGAACVAGLCEATVLAAPLYYARRMAIDTKFVYWTSPQGAKGNVLRIPLSGGTPLEMASKQGDPFDIAVDGANVYWTNTGDDTVMAAPLAGGAPVLLAEAGNPLAIAVQGSRVYFTNTYSKTTVEEQVLAVSITAGAVTTVASTPGALMLAVDAERAYWTDAASHAIWKAPLAGGSPELLAADVLAPTDIAVDEAAVYFNGLEGTFRVDLAGGMKTALVWGLGHGLALDATHVYVGTADGRLLRVPKSGGKAVTLAQAPSYANDIAVDATRVYWIQGKEAGALLSVAK